jgi:hypothetical protein
LFAGAFQQPRNLILSVPGLGTFSLQDVLQQQGEGGDDMVYVAADERSTAPAAAPGAAATIKGDNVLEQELPPATADVLEQLHLSLQQQEQEQRAMQAAYPAGAAAVSSLTDTWIGSSL